ncbi:endonuclease [Flavobacterium humi]|uniref:T9SS type A sorting domain-containing protein n=1 Tax=Flavobacterium humi TaxID=2562683 RepID=A0A4Z0LD61_9FLAO|nr:endonuclease [Flavobacterium humi]TGD59816.1 T9SS type A sorting domain-containing protein [Flavobacterium humi]
MKSKLVLLAFLFSIFSFSQIPSGYYNTATGTGYTLKTQLYNKIKGHSDKGYAGLWTTFGTSDRDNQYENDNTIIDIYSENPTGADPYEYTYSTDQCGTYSVEGNCYNREHIVPQSVFNESAPMVSDAHHITPTDGKVNGMRGNYPHGKVATVTWTSLNGSKLGSSAVSGYSGTVFEPVNEFKGDIARMYFYFATRYENTIAGYSYPMFNGTSNQVFTNTFRDMLLAWHTQDPVSAREIARNNAIYARQGNRNPYIDHPEYVNAIWGTVTPPADTQAPTAPSNVTVSNIAQTSLTLNWTASTDNVAVTGYDIYMNGSLKTSISVTTASITGLTAATAYSFYIKAKDAAGNTSASSATVNTTTSSSSATATDLYFSEYLEGSSNNKAIEITNATGSSVSLSSYSIKKQTNGSGSWSTGLVLSGTMANGAKFVLVNSSISSACYPTSSANVSTTATELAFNGNDALGLFKNGVLIDIIGTFNGGTADFSIDETLRRKTTVTVPKTTFNKSADWTVYTTDTCSGIGNRLGQEAETKEITTGNDFRIYPNPSHGEFTIGFETTSAGSTVAIYSVVGEKVFERTNNTGIPITISHLEKGIYLIKFTKDSKTITKKIIIN